MDISYNFALGHNPPLPSNPDTNHLQLHQPPTGKKCLKTYKAEAVKHALPTRQFNLEQSTSVGVSLSPTQQLEVIEIDTLKTKAMLRASSKCRKVYLGKVSFSEAVDVPKRLLIFCQTAMHRRKGLRVSTNLWKHRKKNAKIDLNLKAMSLDDLENQLRLARSACRKANKDHVALCEAFWDTFDPKVRDRLKLHEQARNLGCMTRVINGN